jgi:hypothetical protein
VRAALAADQIKEAEGGDPHFDPAGEAALLLGVFGTLTDRDMLAQCLRVLRE